jgi:hypothetical protein
MHSDTGRGAGGSVRAASGAQPRPARWAEGSPYRRVIGVADPAAPRTGALHALIRAPRRLAAPAGCRRRATHIHARLQLDPAPEQAWPARRIRKPVDASGRAHNGGICHKRRDQSITPACACIKRSAPLRPATVNHGWSRGGGGQVSGRTATLSRDRRCCVVPVAGPARFWRAHQARAPLSGRRLARRAWRSSGEVIR